VVSIMYTIILDVTSDEQRYVEYLQPIIWLAKISCLSHDPRLVKNASIKPLNVLSISSLQWITLLPM
jgi:hypothetical protein